MKSQAQLVCNKNLLQLNSTGQWLIADTTADNENDDDQVNNFLSSYFNLWLNNLDLLISSVELPLALNI